MATDSIFRILYESLKLTIFNSFVNMDYHSSYSIPSIEHLLLLAVYRIDYILPAHILLQHAFFRQVGINTVAIALFSLSYISIVS